MKKARWILALAASAALAVVLTNKRSEGGEEELAAKLCHEAIARQDARYASQREFLAKGGKEETREAVAERVSQDELATVCRNVLKLPPVWDTAKAAAAAKGAKVKKPAAATAPQP